MFLTLTVIGLAGLAAMAMPALARLGHAHAHAQPTHAPQVHGAHGGPGLRGLRGHGAPTAGRGRSDVMLPADTASRTLLRFVPSLRAICSALALYGAFGNALVRAAHWAPLVAGLSAVVPALLVERFTVRPVWNLLFRFQGQPSSPLEELVMAEARAVVPFRNGRGLVSAERDGRVVQLLAQLRGDQAALAVKVGDRLRIDDVDARRERVTVSLLD